MGFPTVPKMIMQIGRQPQAHAPHETQMAGMKSDLGMQNLANRGLLHARHRLTAYPIRLRMQAG